MKSDSRKLFLTLPDIHIAMRSLSTHRFFPFYKVPHNIYTTEQTLYDDEVHEALAQQSDAAAAVNADVVELQLTEAEARWILVAVTGCEAELGENHNDLHTMLDLDDAEPLRALAQRLRDFLRQFDEESM